MWIVQEGVSKLAADTGIKRTAKCGKGLSVQIPGLLKIPLFSLSNIMDWYRLGLAYSLDLLADLLSRSTLILSQGLAHFALEKRPRRSQTTRPAEPTVVFANEQIARGIRSPDLNPSG
jgi:hypothetical protein